MKKKFSMVTSLSLAILILNTSSGNEITKNDLEYILSQRMSFRNWKETSIEYELMKTLCDLSLVSAFELEGMKIYISNSTGVYQYEKNQNKFILKNLVDLRHSLSLDVGQTFISLAPCIIIIVYDEEIEPNPLEAYRRSGIIIQNLYIISIRYGLCGVCIGAGIYYEEVAKNIQKDLGLSENLRPTLLFPIGHLPEGEGYPRAELKETTGNLPSPLESAADVTELFKGTRQLSTAWEEIGVSPQKLSNILWATYGYSLLGTKHRTVPSAYGEYPFKIYVFNETGIYNYDPEFHSLYQIGFGDKRLDIITASNLPEYLEKAPVLLLLCWNSQVGTHNASDSDSGGRFINAGYGCCLQNLYLSAAAWNIGISRAFHIDHNDSIQKQLSEILPQNIYPMYLIGLGELYEDKDPPIIGSPSRTPAGEISSSQKVKIEVEVIDEKSGIDNVILSYTINNGIFWNDIKMDYNVDKKLYEAIIPEKPSGTQVKYKIIAVDKAKNVAIEDNKGEHFKYMVIIESRIMPEYIMTLILVMLLISSFIIIILKREKIKGKLLKSNNLAFKGN